MSRQSIQISHHSNFTGSGAVPFSSSLNNRRRSATNGSATVGNKATLGYGYGYGPGGGLVRRNSKSSLSGSVSTGESGSGGGSPMGSLKNLARVEEREREMEDDGMEGQGSGKENGHVHGLAIGVAVSEEGENGLGEMQRGIMSDSQSVSADGRDAGRRR
jgi:hypothetical protein